MKENSFEDCLWRFLCEKIENLKIFNEEKNISNNIQ